MLPSFDSRNCWWVEDGSCVTSGFLCWGLTSRSVKGSWLRNGVMCLYLMGAPACGSSLHGNKGWMCRRSLAQHKTQILKKYNYYLFRCVNISCDCWVWHCSLWLDCRCSLAGNAHEVSLFQFESQGKDFFFLFIYLYFFQKVECRGRWWGLHVPCMQLIACVLERFRLALSSLVFAEW